MDHEPDLIDDATVTPTFVDRCASIGMANGVVRMTFTVLVADEHTGKTQRVVVERLAMPAETIGQFAVKLLGFVQEKGLNKDPRSPTPTRQ